MILTVPQDRAYYPTLGPQVCAFIEDNLVFGPGDLRGQPAVLDDEKRGLIYRMYEIYPQDHEQAGRRRFKRCALSLRKGSAKTEFAAWIAACELHPEAPVRCIGWDKKGEPIGGPVRDPYIPMVAYTEEQSEELAYGALRVILEQSLVADDFDIGLERIMRKDGSGKAVALATAPDSTDGARTTFQHFDETHRMTLPRLVRAHKTMLANIPKRKLADAWSLETTTAPEPGAGSVAEATMDYAKAVDAGLVKDVRLFFFHREAGTQHDLSTDEGVRAAVMEAAGPVAAWADNESIVEQWKDPTSDKAYLERVWLNRLVQASSQAFDVDAWKKGARDTNPAKRGDLIVLGFDGSQFHDSTALIATHVKTGYQWKAGLWERPASWREERPWQVAAHEVDQAVRAMFDEYTVWRMYADPPYWESMIAVWVGVYGKERVVEWFTTRRRQMAAAIRGYVNALKNGEILNDGDPDITRHIGNARKMSLPSLDELGQPEWLIQKERPDSPHKIDGAMASILSWEARTDAIASGTPLETADVLVEWI